MKNGPGVSRLRVAVTGGAQGIGKTIAGRFASSGAAVAILDRDREKAVDAADRLCESGALAIAVHVDVSDEVSVHQAFQAVERELGGVDVLVNNAAIFSTLSRQPFDQIGLVEWRRVMAVNVDGAFLCARAVAPGMKAAGWGRVINISSNTVGLGRTGFLHYVSSKAAIIGFTNALARELGEHGVTVNAIMPSLTRTEVEFKDVSPAVFDALVAHQCVKRTGLPEDIAEAALFLASHGANFITGQTIAVDGGAVHR
jgi:NAD(P)-dependent dehydrogenase (short-subunit alcohol dehydrogenase family)